MLLDNLVEQRVFRLATFVLGLLPVDTPCRLHHALHCTLFFYTVYASCCAFPLHQGGNAESYAGYLAPIEEASVEGVLLYMTLRF